MCEDVEGDWRDYCWFVCVRGAYFGRETEDPAGWWEEKLAEKGFPVISCRPLFPMVLISPVLHRLPQQGHSSIL